MSEIETYIAVEQFFGGGELFGEPQGWEIKPRALLTCAVRPSRQ
jgi:hypothetical protein